MYYLRDEDGQQFTDLFEVHIIELRKKLDGSNPVDDWIHLFNARTEEISELCKCDLKEVEEVRKKMR